MAGAIRRGARTARRRARRRCRRHRAHRQHGGARPRGEADHRHPRGSAALSPRCVARRRDGGPWLRAPWRVRDPRPRVLQTPVAAATDAPRARLRHRERSHPGAPAVPGLPTRTPRGGRALHGPETGAGAPPPRCGGVPNWQVGVHRGSARASPPERRGLGLLRRPSREPALLASRRVPVDPTAPDGLVERARRGPHRVRGALRSRLDRRARGLHRGARCRPSEDLHLGTARCLPDALERGALLLCHARESIHTSTHMQMSVGRASLFMIATLIGSRFLGWLRLSVIGAKFGQTPELDAFWAAFRIPDTLFNLLVAGALASAFIPVFTGYLAKEREDEAWRVASSVMNAIVLSLMGFSAVLWVLAPSLVPTLAQFPDPAQRETAIHLSRIMRLRPIFMRIRALFTRILN